MFASKWNGWQRRHARRGLVVCAALFATFAGSGAPRGQSATVPAAGPEGTWREHPVVARALAAAEREPGFGFSSTGSIESLLPLSHAARLRSF